YFATLRIPLLAGRMFSAADTDRSQRVLIVNQTLAKRFFAPRSPVGERLLFTPNGKPGEIVGVVGDVKQDRIEGEEWPTIYGPYPQLPYLTMAVAVRT